MAVAAQIPQPGDTVAGKYLLEAMLGQGGMGAVFRARHLLTDRKVALKWMLPDEQAGDAAVQRFLREARAMGRIEHPSVVGVLDVGVEGDAAYLVMELLRGSSLRDRIEAAGKLAPREAIALLLPAMEGLAAAHAAGVVHRDIKPDNVFCVSGGGTKVLDFGVSKLQGDRFSAPGGVGSSAITHTGAMVGTPAYMAPEQVRGERDLDARTDVWALGAILYEALSGKLPFAHETLGQTIVAIATMAPPRLESVEPTVPVALADVIHRALEKDLDARWASVEAFARALLPFAEGSTFTTPRPSSVHPPASGETRLDSGHSVPAGPRPKSHPTSARTTPSGVDVEVAITPSPKTSTTSATPFVSSSAHRTPPPTSGMPWAWMAAGGSLVAAGLGAFLVIGGGAPPASPSVEPAATHLAASVVSARDAGTDTAPPTPTPTPTPPSTSISTPPSTSISTPPSTSTSTPAEPRSPRLHPPRTPHPVAAELPPPGTGAEPTTSGSGRTGRLSRDDF